MGFEITPHKIVKIIDETPTIKSFRLSNMNGPNANFLAGQFANLSLEHNGEQIRRPFSYTSAPKVHNDYVEFTIKMVNGKFTGPLAAKKEGDIVGLQGPFGRFHIDETVDKPIVFIAGGVGSAPIMSMIRHLLLTKPGHQMVLFYSCKTADEIIYKKELEEIAKRHPSFKLIMTLTQDSNGWHGLNGRIDTKMLKGHLSKFDDKLYYLCGSPEMVEGVIVHLKELGVADTQIQKEEWNA